MNETFRILDNSSSTLDDTNLSSLNCPIFTEEEQNIVDHFYFWVGGVGVCIVSCTGLFLNLTAICVLLTRLSKHNNFNHLIVILFVVDSLYLVLSVINTFRMEFGFKPRILTILFPKITFPMCTICLTLSIFMTVGIAHERYIAVKHPIIHRQRMISAKFRRISLMKYIVSVVFCAVAFNIPKFFEVELNWKNSTEVIDMNNTQYR